MKTFQPDEMVRLGVVLKRPSAVILAEMGPNRLTFPFQEVLTSSAGFTNANLLQGMPGRALRTDIGN